MHSLDDIWCSSFVFHYKHMNIDMTLSTLFSTNNSFRRQFKLKNCVYCLLFHSSFWAIQKPYVEKKREKKKKRINFHQNKWKETYTTRSAWQSNWIWKDSIWNAECKCTICSMDSRFTWNLLVFCAFLFFFILMNAFDFDTRSLDMNDPI